MIYLSICIPTYNRVEYLKKSLDSIVNQHVFSLGEIEIVISDNASIDGTSELLCNYQNYPNIHYFRNDTNEGVNVNIYKCLTLATGIYRKVSNDTFLYKDGSLLTMLNIIKKLSPVKPCLLFTNKCIKKAKKDEITIYNLDVLINTISYYFTWDGVLGFWDIDCKNIHRNSITEWFWSIPEYLKSYLRTSKAVLHNSDLFTTLSVQKKDLTYGLIDVFYTHFFDQIQKYTDFGLSHRALLVEKNRMLYRFFLPWFVTIKCSNNYCFSDKDTLENLRKAYNSNLLVFTFFLSVLSYLQILKNRMKSLVYQKK